MHDPYAVLGLSRGATSQQVSTTVAAHAFGVRCMTIGDLCASGQASLQEISLTLAS